MHVCANYIVANHLPLHCCKSLTFPFQHQSVVNELSIINSGQIMAKLKITNTCRTSDAKLTFMVPVDDFPLLCHHKRK